MAWFRSRRSPYQGGMIVSGVMSASWACVDAAVGLGQGRAGRQRGAVRAVEREAPPGRGGDEVAAVVDHLVVPGAQADQVVQVGAAAVDPVLDVVQVGPAGLAPREPAPAVVPFPGGAADRGAGAAAAPAQGQHRAGVAVGHPRQRGGAGDHLRGGHADRRAVLDMAPGRVRRVTRDPRRGRGRFRGNAGRVRGRDRRPGEHAGAGVHHDLVHLRVIGPGDLPGQERLRHRDQPVSQVRRRPDRRAQPRGGLARVRRVRGAAFPRRPAFPRKRPRGGSPRQVGAGSPQRLQQHRALQGRQPERARQRPVLLEPPRQPAPHPGIRVTGRVTWRWARANRSSWFAVIGPASSASPASVAGAAIRVSARTLAYDSRAGGEPGPDHRQVPQRPGHPDMLPGGAGGHLALPRQPLRAGPHLPADAQPRRASKSASRTRNRHVAAARCPASSQICASTRSSGTRAGSAGDAATSAGGETAAKTEPGLSVSNMHLTLTAGSDKTG